MNTTPQSTVKRSLLIFVTLMAASYVLAISYIIWSTTPTLWKPSVAVWFGTYVLATAFLGWRVARARARVRESYTYAGETADLETILTGLKLDEPLYRDPVTGVVSNFKPLPTPWKFGTAALDHPVRRESSGLTPPTEETAMAEEVDESKLFKEQCLLPPAGWTCTRGRYHVGPCATIPDDETVLGVDLDSTGHIVGKPRPMPAPPTNEEMRDGLQAYAYRPQAMQPRTVQTVFGTELQGVRGNVGGRAVDNERRQNRARYWADRASTLIEENPNARDAFEAVLASGVHAGLDIDQIDEAMRVLDTKQLQLTQDPEGRTPGLPAVFQVMEETTKVAKTLARQLRSTMDQRDDLLGRVIGGMGNSLLGARLADAETVDANDETEREHDERMKAVHVLIVEVTQDLRGLFPTFLPSELTEKLRKLEQLAKPVDALIIHDEASSIPDSAWAGAGELSVNGVIEAGDPAKPAQWPTLGPGAK